MGFGFGGMGMEMGMEMGMGMGMGMREMGGWGGGMGSWWPLGGKAFHLSMSLWFPFEDFGLFASLSSISQSIPLVCKALPGLLPMPVALNQRCAASGKVADSVQKAGRPASQSNRSTCANFERQTCELMKQMKKVGFQYQDSPRIKHPSHPYTTKVPRLPPVQTIRETSIFVQALRAALPMELMRLANRWFHPVEMADYGKHNSATWKKMAESHGRKIQHLFHL